MLPVFGWWRMDGVLAFFFFLFLSGLTVSCWCAHRFLFSLSYQCLMFPTRQKRADSFFINSSQWKRQTCECTRGSHLCFRPSPRPLFHPLSPPAKTKSNILLFIQLNWKWRIFFSTSDVHIVNVDLYRRSNAFFIYIFTTFKMHLSLSLCFSQKTEYLKRQANVFSGICKRNLMV